MYQLILTKLIRYRTVMRGSRNFRQGGGPGQSDKKSSDNLFLVLSLFYSRKENYHFSRFPRGSNIFQGGGGSNFFRGGGFQLLIPIENI